MSISIEGNRWVRAETTTFSATTMAMNTTVIRVAMPPRLNLLERKGFAPFFFVCLGSIFFSSVCFTSVCFVSIVNPLLSSSGGFPPYGR